MLYKKKKKKYIQNIFFLEHFKFFLTKLKNKNLFITKKNFFKKYIKNNFLFKTFEIEIFLTKTKKNIKYINFSRTL